MSVRTAELEVAECDACGAIRTGHPDLQNSPMGLYGTVQFVTAELSTIEVKFYACNSQHMRTAFQTVLERLRDPDGQPG